MSSYACPYCRKWGLDARHEPHCPHTLAAERERVNAAVIAACKAVEEAALAVKKAVEANEARPWYLPAANDCHPPIWYYDAESNTYKIKG